MAPSTISLKAMRRLLFAHQWDDAADWAQAIFSLAELADDEIERLAQPAGAAPAPRRQHRRAAIGSETQSQSEQGTPAIGRSAVIQPPPRTRRSR